MTTEIKKDNIVKFPVSNYESLQKNNLKQVWTRLTYAQHKGLLDLSKMNGMTTSQFLRAMTIMAVNEKWRLAPAIANSK